jgi:hypothetical protein
MITADFLTSALQTLKDDETELCCEVEGILKLLINHSKAGGFVTAWVRWRMSATYVSEVAQLVHRTNGFHFAAKETTAEHLREFDIDELSTKMSILAPDSWSLLDSLLAADLKINYKHEWRSASGKAPNAFQRVDDVDMPDLRDLDEDDDQFSNDIDECPLHPLVSDEDDEPEDVEDKKKQCTERVIMNVSMI